MGFIAIIILPLYVLCLVLDHSRKTSVRRHVIYAFILATFYLIVLFIMLALIGGTGVSDGVYDASLFIPAQLFIPLPYILMIIKANTFSSNKGFVINIYILLSTYFAALVLFLNANFFFNSYIWLFIYIFIIFFTLWFIQRLFPAYRISNLMKQVEKIKATSLNIFIFYFFVTILIVLINNYASSPLTKGVVQISYFIIPYIFCLFLWLFKNQTIRRVNLTLISLMITGLIICHHYFIFDIELLEYNSIFISLLIPIPYILILIRSKMPSQAEKTAYTIITIPFSIIAFTASLIALQVIPITITLLIYTPFFIRKYYR